MIIYLIRIIYLKVYKFVNNQDSKKSLYIIWYNCEDM